jgi:hypothetical protein
MSILRQKLLPSSPERGLICKVYIKKLTLGTLMPQQSRNVLTLRFVDAQNPAEFRERLLRWIDLKNRSEFQVRTSELGRSATDLQRMRQPDRSMKWPT